MQSPQDWKGKDLANISMWRDRPTIPFWDLLSDALMRSGLIEVVDIGSQDPLELPLLQNEQVIEALATHTAKKTFTDGIGSRSVIGRFENLDATRLGNPREGHAKFAIVVTGEVFWPTPKAVAYRSC